MATLYLIEQNTILRKQGQRLLLCKRPPAKRRYSAVLQGDIVLDLPAADVEQVMLFGNIQITTSALQLLLGKGIEIALFSYGGQLLGQLTPALGRNVHLRLEQFRRYREAGFTREFARQVVCAKIANGLAFLRQFHKNHPAAFPLEELALLERSLAQAEVQEDLDILRGHEGAAAARYFELFSRVILPPWQFSGRNKRPPRDPVNAVLSFGYVVLGSQLQWLLDGVGLDPYLGFYHQVDYGRPSLALDLLEELRHPFIDRLAAVLFNQNIMQAEDFMEPAGGGVYLNTSGKRKFFEQYEKMLGELSQGLDEPGGPGYFPVLQRQVQRLTRAIQENEPYEPYRFQLD